MSPYRVLVEDKSKEGQYICIARLSIDHLGNRWVYITRKTVPVDVTDLNMLATVAYLQTSTRNSIVLDKYKILYMDCPNAYRVTDSNAKYKLLNTRDRALLPGIYPSYSKCLEGAMKNYTHLHDINIIQEIQ